jgi:anti-sigma factor RsiW
MTHAADPRNDANDAVHALLPWYVNGTLPDGDRARIERLLQQAPDLRGEVYWLQRLRLHMREAAPEQDRAGSELGDSGLARLHALIRAEQCKVAVPLPARAGPRPRAWINWSLPLALAATFVLSVIVTVYLPSRDGTLEPLSGQTTAADAVIVQVTFKPSAPEGEIRQLIASVQGEIVAGPGALGVYSLRVQKPQADQALATLRARKDLVESVSPAGK